MGFAFGEVHSFSVDCADGRAKGLEFAKRTQRLKAGVSEPFWEAPCRLVGLLDFTEVPGLSAAGRPTPDGVCKVVPSGRLLYRSSVFDGGRPYTLPKSTNLRVRAKWEYIPACVPLALKQISLLPRRGEAEHWGAAYGFAPPGQERRPVAPQGHPPGAAGPQRPEGAPVGRLGTPVQHPKVQTQKGGLDSFFVAFLGRLLFLSMDFFGSAKLSDHLNIYFIRLDSILFEFNKVFQ